MKLIILSLIQLTLQAQCSYRCGYVRFNIFHIHLMSNACMSDLHRHTSSVLSIILARQRSNSWVESRVAFDLPAPRYDMIREGDRLLVGLSGGKERKSKIVQNRWRILWQLIKSDASAFMLQLWNFKLSLIHRCRTVSPCFMCCWSCNAGLLWSSLWLLRLWTLRLQSLLPSHWSILGANRCMAGANSDSTGIVAVWCLMPFAVWRTLRFPCHALNRLLARVEIAHFLTWSNCISWFMVSPTLCSDLLDMHDEIVLNDTLWEQILCVHAQFTKAKHGKTTVRGF